MACPDASEKNTATPTAAAPDGETREAPIATVRAAELLGPRGIVRIEHEGEIYTLRLTRNSRLILTK